MTDFYFAYGMLTNPDIMPKSRLVGSARLQGYSAEMLMYANARRDPQGEMVGVLWEINRSILRQLDQIEAYPDLYDRMVRPVTMLDTGEVYDAWVYTMDKATRDDCITSRRKPARNYLRAVAAGYELADLDNPFGEPYEQE